jgi:glucosylceramidase
MCQGAVTIDGDKVSRNLAYYTIGHASKFVPDGSVRIESSMDDSIANVAFLTPDGKTVLVVANNSKDTQNFNIKYQDKAIQSSLAAGSVATYVW